MKTSIKVFHWLPRIICIVSIFFISIFAADAFAPGLTICQQLRDFLIHLIPSFVLLGVFIVAWRWELIGGIIFFIIGVVMSPFVFMLNYHRNHIPIGMCFVIVLMITFPFIITGVLFIISHSLKKKDHTKE